MRSVEYEELNTSKLKERKEKRLGETENFSVEIDPKPMNRNARTEYME